MKQLFGILGLVLLLATPVFGAADIQRGKTFTSNEEVTSTKLHNLVDDATITNIDQTDIATNYGFVFRSGTAPSDTDALWYDTGNTLLKAYTGSAWGVVPSADPTFTTITTTGAGTIGTTLGVTGVVTLSSDLTVGGDSTVSGHLFAPDQLGNWSTVTKDTNIQAPSDGFVVVTYVQTSAGTYDIQLLSDASTPPTVVRCREHLDSASTSGTSAGACGSIVKKDEYYKITDTGSGTTTGYFIPFD